MAKGKGLAGLLFVLGADIKEFQTEMRKATNDMKRFGKDVMDIGKDFTKYATVPLVGFATGAVMSFRTVNEAMKQVQAGIISTGGAAGFTADELKKLAARHSELSNNFSADILKDVTAQLLTFTNVTGPNFEKAQIAVMDVAARMGTDMKSSAIMVGKALNDPIQGLTAMRRVGIQFTDQQEVMIKSMVEAGDVLGSQNEILKELERQFGGSAAASGDMFNAMSNQAKELGASFGEMINNAIAPLIRGVTDLMRWITGLSDTTKGWVLGIGAVVTAIGPLLMAIGFMAKTVLPMFISGLAATKLAFAKLTAVMMANPYVAIGAAIAAIVAALVFFKNRTNEAEDAQWKLGNAVKEVNKEIGKQIYQALAIGAKTGSDGAIELTGNLEKLRESMKQMTKQELESLKTYLEDAYSEAARAATNSTSELNKTILEQDMIAMKQALVDVTAELTKFNTTVETTTKRVGIISSLNDELKKLGEAKALATTEGEIAKLNDKIKALEERLKSLNELTTRAPNMKGMESRKAGAITLSVDTSPTEMAFRNVAGTAIALGDTVKSIWAGMSDYIMTAADVMGSAVDELGTQLGNAFAGAKVSFEGLVSSMLGGIRQILNALLAKAIAGMIAGESTKGLPGLITATIGVAAISAMFANKVPKMAAGGIVPPGYPGDSYPAMLTSGERVIPPKKLDSFASPIDNITVFVKGKFAGSDLLLVTERAQVNRSKIRG